MKWTSTLSTEATLEDAIAECALKVRSEIDSPDLIVVFISAHHSEKYHRLPDLLRKHLTGGLLIGCSAGGIIGEGHEVEDQPGISLSAAVLPSVNLSTFHITDDALPDGDAPPNVWEQLVNVAPENDPIFLMLADPFSIRSEHLLMGLDYAFPNKPKIGGLASGAHQRGDNVLYLGDEIHKSGVVGIGIHGDISIDTVVAQGCRPIGPIMHITSCERNILNELGGKTTFEMLKEVFEGLNERDKRLAQHSLFLGVVMDELNDKPGIGDFLIRNIISADPRSGSLVIGELLKEGQTVQFHLRDAETSGQDLEAILNEYVSKEPNFEDSGALLFSCLGRGIHLYGKPNHDTDMFKNKIGEIPLTGFFCNGEIGPVGETTFLHGYTSSFGIFKPKS